MANKVDLRSLTPPALADLTRELGADSYRSGQIARWVWQKGAAAVAEMTDLPQALRGRLDEIAELAPVSLVKQLISREDGTRKYLFAFADGEMVESVLMRYSYGLTACVSTQAGCRMGCRFCASGLNGLARNLSAGEIYAQVLGMQKDRGERIGHVVLMGSGEPLDNYDATLTFIKNITAPYGLNISERRLTLSTCGLAPRILELGAAKLALTLAVSLHAPNDNLRNQLMPINKKYPLKQLIAACRAYANLTGRRVTFEYALIDGVNDQPAQAVELAGLVRGLLSHVNLIAVNPAPELGVKPPVRSRVAAFKNVLEQNGVAVSVRRKLGGEITAACGQLRNRAREAP